MPSAPGPSSFADAVERRRRLGAWYTPPTLVDHVVAAAIPAVPLGGERVSVLDPACGDGRFLLSAARRVRSLGGVPVLVGVDVDRGAVQVARRSLRDEDATVFHDDALTRQWGRQRFDVVVGNPPFLSQLAAATTRGGASRHGGGPYANAAVEFLALAARLARERGGRVGLVLPLSVLSSRDAAPVRRDVRSRAELCWLWWSPTPVFDAAVRTCALGFENGGAAAEEVPRTVGPDFAPADPLARSVAAAVEHWGKWVADALGVPPLGDLAECGELVDHAALNANFRDEYYALTKAVREREGPDDDAPRLVTSGLIDPGSCMWGEVPVRFAKRQFLCPVVDLSLLDERMSAWAARKLVGKVLVATQTRVLEAVADPAGAWLPGVPVITAVPLDGQDLWPVAAVLTSPVASAWVAARGAGSGLAASAVRVSVSTLGQLPWPAGELDRATRALRAECVEECGVEVTRAYGLQPHVGEAAAVVSWWTAEIRRRSAARERLVRRLPPRR